LEYLKK